MIGREWRYIRASYESRMCTNENRYGKEWELREPPNRGIFLDSLTDSQLNSRDLLRELHYRRRHSKGPSIDDATVTKEVLTYLVPA